MEKMKQMHSSASVGRAIKSLYSRNAVSRTLTFTSVALLVGVAGVAQATTERDSIATINQPTYFGSTTIGAEGNALSQNIDISPDGRYTVFETKATNFAASETKDTKGQPLVDGNGAPAPDGHADIYIHDRYQGTTKRLSVDFDNDKSDKNDNTDGENTNPAVSKDGKYVVFESTATDLIPGGNNTKDIYRVNTETGQVELVSVDIHGEPANGASSNPQITWDGRYVVFESDASDLVADDKNQKSDIFVRDMETGETQRVSLAPHWQESKFGGGSHNPSISAWGQWVVFSSDATDLIDGLDGDDKAANGFDTNKQRDVFYFDRHSGEMKMMSVTPDGKPGDGVSDRPDISGDGQYVAFDSKAKNLVASDVNKAVSDIFVRGVHGSNTQLVSTDSNGKQKTAGDSIAPSISENGSKVAFESKATLTPTPVAGVSHIYVKDRNSGEVLRASVDSAATPGNDDSSNANISADGRFTAFDSTATNLPEPGDRKLNTDGYHRDDFSTTATSALDDYLYSRRPDTNGVKDVFVHHVNLAPVFEPKNQYHCKNAGGQSFYLWNWVHNFDDGDHPGQRENVRFTVDYVENPGLFGGLLDVGGQPNVTWPSHTLNYRPALNESGSSEVCVTLKDDGLTAQGGADTTRQCFTINVDANCDDGNGEIFGTGLFDFDVLAANQTALEILDFDKSSINGNTHDVKVNITNPGSKPIKNAELHLTLRGAQKITEADPHCQEATGGVTGQYLCKFSEVPVGKTTLDFKALGVGEITGSGGFEPAKAEVPPVSGASTFNSEGGSQGSTSGDNNGGGSLGWLSLIALGLLGRRKLRK